MPSNYIESVMTTLNRITNDEQRVTARKLIDAMPTDLPPIWNRESRNLSFMGSGGRFVVMFYLSTPVGFALGEASEARGVFIREIEDEVDPKAIVERLKRLGPTLFSVEVCAALGSYPGTGNLMAGSFKPLKREGISLPPRLKRASRKKKGGPGSKA
jgi:hypothetical protein